ncbi:bifunctional hydroxymethylpyrimidine kinase/phosphomethylpyrimidine kinase [Arhodomonas sp. AD133]|uniref:bifunctional hydroxymethylpyrimidine kinase/phosphomethylpyrimidine kinase n=1 Tax=Arhodomonas sp. AD133 TaxID=3415009 RepID=UPI003EBDC5A5
MTQARVLIVAGSDSGGGAGIQADIKAVSALSGYAATAVTALTAQNTLGVQGVWPVPADFIAAQMRSVLDDIGADCVKTGMLHDAEVIDTVADGLAAGAPDAPLVVDPVMIAQSGDRLLQEDAVTALKQRLLARATVITPNLPEAEVLLGRDIVGAAAQEAAAEALLDIGCRAVLLKGGHAAATDTVTDILATRDEVVRLVYPRIDTRNSHGTGCTLASAIATGLAQGLAMDAAVRRARRYLQRALETARPLGAGHGPVNHQHTVAPFDGGGA